MIREAAIKRVVDPTILEVSSSTDADIFSWELILSGGQKSCNDSYVEFDLIKEKEKVW